MTGFGSASGAAKQGLIHAEIRSYNHRFLDIRLRVAKALQGFEPRVYLWARERLVRGRVEIVIHWEERRETGSALGLDEQVLGFYLAQEKKLREEFGVPGRLDVGTLLTLPGLVVSSEGAVDTEEEWASVLGVLEEALAKMEAMQEREGRALQEDLHERITRLLDDLERIRVLSTGLPERYRARLEERLSKRAPEVSFDPQRIAQEVVLYADKTDITEEVVRLSSHLERCRQGLKSGSMTGKRLEFLTQEINRELNTIGAKTPSPDVTYLVVDMKSEVEKIREQTQNLQ